MVAELEVGPDSEFVGRSVKATGLREKDIVVLSIQRGGLVIPNPRPDREVLAGDTLLCYGVQTALRSLLPALNTGKKKTVSKKAKTSKRAEDETVVSHEG